MKTQMGVEELQCSFFNLSGRWGGWSTPHRDRFTRGKEKLYQLYGRLVSPQGRPGRVRKTSPQPQFDPRIVQRVASRHTDSAIPTHAWISGIIFLEKIISLLGFGDTFHENCTSDVYWANWRRNKTLNFSNRLTFCWPCIMQWFLVIVQLSAQFLFNVFIYL